jgi:trehalose 6-phosphate phosphatase
VSTRSGAHGRPAGTSASRHWEDLDWSAFTQAPGRAAVLADFDGTLAPIVAERAAARPLAGAVEALALLARRYAVAAVISGRPVDFLASVLPGGSALVVVGLYGLERWVSGRRSVAPDVQPWARVVSEAVTAARAAAPPGLEVEDKGLSLTLHSRGAPSTEPWARHWGSQRARETGLRPLVGRHSVELIPPLATDKGTVVEELVGDLGAACFFGDDTGDLPAFACLRRLRSRGRATVSVGVASPEQPPELDGAVDLLVDGPAGALEVLRALAAGR